MDSFAASAARSDSDAYLHANITVLYSANNYLYIFGDTQSMRSRM